MLAWSPSDRRCFRFVCQSICSDSKRLFARIGIQQSGFRYTGSRVGQQVRLCPCELRVGDSNPGCLFCCVLYSLFFVGAMHFVTSIKI